MRILFQLSKSLLIVVMLWLPSQAPGQAVVSTGQSFIKLRLLSGEPQQDGTRLAGLRMIVAPGWKTYWRSPGEAGIPPRFDWSESDNVGAVEVLWPRPEVFQSFGYRTIGYAGEIVLPLRIRPARADQPMTLALTANIGVCREICVLEQAELSEHIARDQRPVGYRQVRRAMARVPQPSDEAGVRQTTCRITGAGRERQLEAVLTFDANPGRTDVVVEGTDQFWVHKTSVEQVDGTIRVAASLRLPEAGGWIDRSTVRMTVLGDNISADIQGCKPAS